MKLFLFLVALTILRSNAFAERFIYDGNWWQKADTQERIGFINGAGDCLTWSVHEPGFNGTGEELVSKITVYYNSHSISKKLQVVEVWKKLVSSAVKRKASSKEIGEVWKNPHWYLNSDWWQQLPQSGENGYLEGFVWCSNYHAKSTDKYSHSIDFYRRNIDDYLKANPGRGKTAVADILRRYRDK